MKKTNTTTSTRSVSSTKKSTAKKAAPKKSTSVLRDDKTMKDKVTKSAPKKTAEKKTAPVVQKATIALKKTAPKKSPVKKVAAKIVEPVAEKTTPVAKKSAPSSGKEGVKMLGILHLAGNLLSGGTLGLILVVLYYFVQKNKLSQLEKETCFEIINFNLSFIIYAFTAAVLMIVLIGFLLIPVVLLTWLILMIVGFIKHISGENYKYPFIIRFVS
jgi:uncharacterized protein